MMLAVRTDRPLELVAGRRRRPRRWSSPLRRRRPWTPAVAGGLLDVEAAGVARVWVEGRARMVELVDGVRYLLVDERASSPARRFRLAGGVEGALRLVDGAVVPWGSPPWPIPTIEEEDRG